MKKPSPKANKLVRRSAADIPDPTPEELDCIKIAMAKVIDTSDIPEIKKLGPRPKRDPSDRLQKKPLNPIRKAILSALGHRQMTRYRLWQKANALHLTLSQSAVYEYLRGERDIGVASVEALMAVAGLKVTSREPPTPKAPAAKKPKRDLVGSGTL